MRLRIARSSAKISIHNTLRDVPGLIYPLGATRAAADGCTNFVGRPFAYRSSLVMRYVVLDTCRCINEPTLNVERRDVDSGGFVGVKNTHNLSKFSMWVHQARVVRKVALME